ncbi:MAG: hypothetical protein WCP70_12430 [Methanothrix sp.]
MGCCAACQAGPAARTRVLGRGDSRALRCIGQEDFMALKGGLDNWIAANGNEGERALPCQLCSAPKGGASCRNPHNTFY